MNIGATAGHTLFRAILYIATLYAFAAFAQTLQMPDFTYQGRLNMHGQPANGNFDLSFPLFGAASGGNPIGNAIGEAQFPIVYGVFTVDLASPGVFNGQQLWLEVGVNGQALLPRQPITTAPVAQFALNQKSLQVPTSCAQALVRRAAAWRFDGGWQYSFRCRIQWREYLDSQFWRQHGD
jgi:hypothetical protein